MILDTRPKSSKFLKMRIFLLVAVYLLFNVLVSPAIADMDVRVALTDLKPSLYTDDQGKPVGFFVDLIEDLAAKEDWNVIWVRGSLSESWERLASGDIDLMPGVAASPEREKMYDFSHEPALSGWSQVYAHPGSGINTILDLEGKRIALVKGDINNIAFRDYAQKFGINTSNLEKDIPTDVFEAVAAGEADALVVFNLAGHEDAITYGLSETPVMFNPTPLGFAVLKGTNQDLLSVIDPYIKVGKGSNSSTYSKAIQKWFGIKADEIIHPWLLWGLLGVACLAVLFVFMSYILRREVRRKTSELAKQNEELQYEVLNRTRAEAELVQKNDELRAAYEQLTAMDSELRKNFQELMKSDQALMQARKKLNMLNTLTFQDIQNAIFSLSGYIEISHDAGSLEEAKTYLQTVEQILQSIQNTLTYTDKYQNIGISQPRWQNVEHTLIFAISHLDFSTISRTMEMPDFEIYADPLLEDVFLALMETILHNGVRTFRISHCNHQNTDGIVILIETDGPGIPLEDKEKVFSREHTGKGGTNLFLAREILSITGISLQENGEPGKGIRFEIAVPKDQYRIVDSPE